MKATIAGSVVAACGLLAVPLMAYATPSPSPTPTASPTSTTTSATSTCTTAQHVQDVWSKLPGALQADLVRLKKAKPGKDRAAVAREIEKSAREGHYGARAEKLAQRVKRVDGNLWATMPTNLKHDVRAYLSATSGQQERAAKIVEKAVAGDYGRAVQRLADRLEQSPIWTGCRV
jgi:hypothetical protein